MDNITVKMVITIEGKILNIETKSNLKFYHWSDMESNADPQYTLKNISSLIKKYDSLEYITIELSDSNVYNEKIISSKRLVMRFGELKEMTWNEKQRCYIEDKEYNREETPKMFKKLLKINITEYFKKYEKIHLQKMYELINKTA
jgi:hypothetical protein